MITIADILKAVSAYRDTHGGRSPERAYVSQEDADALSGGACSYPVPGSFMFGGMNLGVTTWYVDPAMTEGIRFDEPPKLVLRRFVTDLPWVEIAESPQHFAGSTLAGEIAPLKVRTMTVNIEPGESKVVETPWGELVSVFRHLRPIGVEEV